MTARVILACLLPCQLKRLYESRVHEPDELRQGDNWKGFSKTMLLIRKQGYWISKGNGTQIAWVAAEIARRISSDA